MIICIQMDRTTKDILDQMVGEGHYRDFSEAISVAVANQSLLHRSSLVSPSHIEPTVMVSVGLEHPSISKSTVRVETATQNNGDLPFAIPSLFQRPADPNADLIPAPLPNDAFIPGMPVPVDRWMFGQHNKLLPAKANVRALSNLLQRDIKHGAVQLDRAATEIASAASNLGDVLRHLDTVTKRSRDDSFAVAFPSTDPSNSDKSRLRYATQLVGALSREGRTSGLLIDLKLINLDRQKRIRLTEPGIQFAALRNPILDSPGLYAHERFSAEETDFLIGHITSSIPVERFAYVATLTSIESGSNTPEKLDDSLKKYMPERAERPFSNAFLTTQRAGVISRMADLGLVERARNGPNVTYVVTDKGKQFIERGR